MDVHNLYLQLQTLDAVGKRLGITRERVRQLLRIGTSLSLFEYKPNKKGRRFAKQITKEELLATYIVHPSLRVVAVTHHISLPALYSLLTTYSVTREQLGTLRQERRRRKCIEQYTGVTEELGHHPPITEMCRKPEWRALAARIIKLWGSIVAFREDLRIPQPKMHQQAIIARQKDINSIRECLKKSSPLSKREVAVTCNLPLGRVQRLLSFAKGRT